jgi:hypothetical protein
MFHTDPPDETCCDVYVNYNYIDSTGTVGQKTGVAAQYYPTTSNAAVECAQLVQGASIPCLYKDLSPYNDVKYKKRYQEFEDTEEEGAATILGLQIIGFHVVAVYVCVFCCCGCFFGAWCAGCLPEFVSYYVTYLCFDCWGSNAKAAEIARREKEEQEQSETRAMLESYPDGYLPDGRPTEEYELVNPDDTRKDLKAQYESAKEYLIGKQLVCIATSETIYDMSIKWIHDHAHLRAQPSPYGEDAPQYGEIFNILDDLKLGMTPDEMSPDHNVLDAFRKSLANHLCMQFKGVSYSTIRSNTLTMFVSI